mmetsp:Transcript_88554/g.251045  ORF Transcript_88554/g.251045 Transcript_88554/m.251045 type:complete len:248 (-) Transcript_88554:289-1032(-)
MVSFACFRRGLHDDGEDEVCEPQLDRHKRSGKEDKRHGMLAHQGQGAGTPGVACHERLEEEERGPRHTAEGHGAPLALVGHLQVPRVNELHGKQRPNHEHDHDEHAAPEHCLHGAGKAADHLVELREGVQEPDRANQPEHTKDPQNLHVRQVPQHARQDDVRDAESHNRQVHHVPCESPEAVPVHKEPQCHLGRVDSQQELVQDLQDWRRALRSVLYAGSVGIGLNNHEDHVEKDQHTHHRVEPWAL